MWETPPPTRCSSRWEFQVKTLEASFPQNAGSTWKSFKTIGVWWGKNNTQPRTPNKTQQKKHLKKKRQSPINHPFSFWKNGSLFWKNRKFPLGRFPFPKKIALKDVNAPPLRDSTLVTFGESNFPSLGKFGIGQKVPQDGINNGWRRWIWQFFLFVFVFLLVVFDFVCPDHVLISKRSYWKGWDFVWMISFH